MSAAANDSTAEAKEVKLHPVEMKMAELLGEVEEELSILEPQYQSLVAIRDRLAGKVPASATPARATGIRRSTSNSNSGRTGGRGGVDRTEDFLRAVRAEPGNKVSYYAEKIGIEANYLYRVRQKAKAAGLVRVEGQNIFPEPEEAVAA